MGAGDCFDAGFLSEFVHGAPLQSCLRKGNLAGALCTNRAAGTEAFRNTAQRENFFRMQAA
jgi:sugar/nucleoside kinase (ribokinase family)